MPTNPIRPLTETTAAVPSVAAITTTSRTLAHGRAERGRLVLADPEHVEVPAMGEQHDRGDDDVRQHQPHVVPLRRRQPAEDPRVDLADDVDVALQDERLHGAGERRHGDAGEHERHAGAAAAERAARRRT